MRNNDLSAMLIVAVLATFTGTATYAQQNMPVPNNPQVQNVPVTPEGKPPPAEVTPDHPLPTTSGAAPRSLTPGRADAPPSKEDERRDREHER
jgi:hypothetical protein